MAVGARTHRLTLRKPNGAGSGFLDVETVWGGLALAGRDGQEALQAAAALATVGWVIEIAYRADVRAEWHVYEALTGRTWQVRGYGDPDDRQRDLLLFAVEVQ